MKRLFYTSLLLLVTTVVYPQTVLDIKFESLKSGKAILYNTSTFDKDTVSIKDGHLAYKNRIKSPTLFYVVVNGYNNDRPIEIILSDEKTQVLFEHFKKPIESQNINEVFPNTPYFLKDPNGNQTFYDFISSWEKFYSAIQQLSTDDSDGLLEKRKAIYHSFLNTCDSIIHANSNKFVSAVIIDYLLNNGLLQLETIQSFYDYLAPSVKDSFFGLKIGEYAGKEGKLKPGNPAPEINLTDLKNGSPTEVMIE